VTDPASAVPDAVNKPDRSSCWVLSASSLLPAVVLTPVICPAGSRE
jgi:hypothetical protein